MDYCEFPKISFSEGVIENYTGMLPSNDFNDLLFSFCRMLDYYGDVFLQGFEEEDPYKEEQFLSYQIQDKVGIIDIQIQKYKGFYQIQSIDIIINK